MLSVIIKSMFLTISLELYLEPVAADRISNAVFISSARVLLDSAITPKVGRVLEFPLIVKDCTM